MGPIMLTLATKKSNKKSKNLKTGLNRICSQTLKNDAAVKASFIVAEEIAQLSKSLFRNANEGMSLECLLSIIFA